MVQTARGTIKHECGECGDGFVTRDELITHEIETDHDVDSPSGDAGYTALADSQDDEDSQFNAALRARRTSAPGR